MYVVFSLMFPYFHTDPWVGHKSNIIRTSRLSQCKTFLENTTDKFLKTSHFIFIVATYPWSQQKTGTVGSHIVCQFVAPLMYMSKCRGINIAVQNSTV